jgi:geranylgeranylglycerol-phosphate geranylgeranyltransferase
LFLSLTRGCITELPNHGTNATVIGGPKPSRRVQPFLRLVRIGNVLVSVAGTVVAGLVALRLASFPELSGLGFVLLAAVSTGCVTAAGNVFNDIRDRTSDRLNHPERPLVSGTVSVTEARLLCVGLFVLGAAVVIPVELARPVVGVVLAIAIGLLLGYEFRWKARGLTGNFFVATLTGAVFLYGGAAAGNLVVVLPFVWMAFGATLSREVIKDMEDAAGDTDRRTVPRVWGMASAALLARGAVLGAVALSGVPFLFFLPLVSVAGIIYLVLVLTADALFVLSVVHLPERLHWEQTMSKVAMTVALGAFLAAALR